MAGFPPLTNQGNLNRVAGHVVVANYTSLNATASNLSKSLLSVTFEGPFTDQIKTATGVVNSPEPFVMAQVTINLLRSQSLAAAWMAQVQANTYLGQVTIYPDSTVFPSIVISEASITDLDPGAFDGMDPTTKVTVKGVFDINANLWAGLTGSAGTVGSS